MPVARVATGAIRHGSHPGNDATGVYAPTIAAISARLIAEAWTIGPCSPRLDGVGLGLGRLHRLAEDRPLTYAQLVPKVARLVPKVARLAEALRSADVA